MRDYTSSLEFLIRSLSRFTYYVTEEEDCVIRYFEKELSQDPKTNIWVYNSIFGLVPIQQVTSDWNTRAHAENRETISIHDALTKIYKTDTQNKRNFYIITDPDRWFRDETVVRRLINIAHQIKNNTTQLKMLVFVGNRRVIPEKLQGYINIVNDPGLDDASLQQRVEQVCKNIVVPTPKDMSPFRGLTSYQIESAITQGIIVAKDKNRDTSKNIDLDHVRVFKRGRLKQTDLISYIDTHNTTFKDVGGLHAFKEWAQKTQAAWTPEGKAFGLKPPRGVLALGVWGCIAEGTRIDYRRGARVSARGRSLPIEVLFEKFNNLKSSTRSWTPGLPTYLQSWDAGTGCIIFNELKGIVDSGVKECIRITTDTGFVELTEDHPVLIQGGSFRPAGELQPGDVLIVRGSMKVTGSRTRKKHNTKKRVIVEGLKYHPVAWKKIVTDHITGVTYSYGRTTRARLVFEARMNNLQYEDYLRILKKSPEVAKTLTYLAAEDDVHHVDENVTNDKLENLMLIPHDRHAQVHWECASTYHQREFTRESKIPTIEHVGPKRTFDVEMREPYPNFALSSGVIVHNCGKSLSVKAMSSAWNLPVIQLEMGRLRSSGVGESEANVYRAIKMIESVAPCVTGDTEVTLADGSTVPIEELWQDTPEKLEVMCWNEKTLRVATTKVDFITRREAEAFQIDAANGYTLNATANHLHYVMRGGMPE